MTKLALAALLIGLVACGGGNNNNVIVVDTPPPVMLCDPLAQTGCMPGEKCATRVLQDNPEITEIACVMDGTVAIDGACGYGPAGASGFSNCKAGGECVFGVCKQICDQLGGSPKCDPNHACELYEGLFESNGMPVAGVCEPKCDPLTQELLVGTTTAACGSTNAAMADTGCFTADLVDFTCTRIPTVARTLTDRMHALSASDGSPYVNGCAAGYIPWLIEKSGSMIAVCSGMCAPAKTDNMNTTNATGDPTVPVKLPTKATAEAGDGLCVAGKKGSAEPEDCHYIWGHHRDRNGAYLPGPYNDKVGLCFAYGQYMVTINGVMTGYPTCEMLPPAGMPPVAPYGNANNWPCVPQAEFTPLFTGIKQAPVTDDFRLSLGSGPGVRHLLRQE
jgi:hypothetical protein